MSILEELRANNILYKEKEQEKKDEQEKEKLKIKEKNILNTFRIWEESLLPVMKRNALEGYNTCCFRLIPTITIEYLKLD